MKRWLVSALASLALAPAAWTSAEHRALIVGVGEHQDASMNLPGIELDTAMMAAAAERLGFPPRSIRTLLDEDATLAAFRRELASLAAARYGADDRVLVYFSGHGTHVPDDNGDESDDKDEALVLHDTRVSGGELHGFLRDDEFGRLLGAIPSSNVLVLVDACHSGSATKSFPAIGERGRPKYFRNPAAAYGSGSSVRARSLVPEPRANHVLLSAAADDELAQATSQGSAFTLGVSEAIGNARGAGRLTAKQLQQAAARRITELVTPGEVHTPQLDGHEPLLSENLFFRAQSRVGPVRRELEALAARLPSMPFTTPTADLRVGQKVVLALDLPRSGYLNVVNVNPNDEALVLFPNAHHKENKVAAGRFAIPADAMDFDLVAREPVGESVTIAFLTERPLNLYANTLKGRDDGGRIVATLAPLSAKAGAAMRNIVVEPREGAARQARHAGKVVVRVSR